MRQGDYAKLVFTQSGNLLAFSTGSDACAEHECGSKELMSQLCNQAENDANVVAELKRRAQGKKTLVERIVGQNDVEYPNILESKRIVKNPESLRFIEKEGKEPEAILSLSRHAIGFDSRELQFRTFISKWGDKDAIGAWDERSFALRVRGKKYVKALKAFYEDMKASKVVFAGTFMKSRDLSGGVILANSKFFGEEIKEDIRKAQTEHENNLRLKAADDTRELLQEMREACGNENSYPGYLWVRWIDEQENGLAYCLNPSHDSQADYIGPYTRQQLLDWAKAKYSYKLTNRKAA